MVTLEERVLKLYAETNPVPSVEGLGLAADEATEYLATFETRSSEVTQLKKRTGEQETTGRSLMPWLVAALLVLVVGVVALVTNEKDSDPIATTPTAIAETAANDPLADFEVYPLRGDLHRPTVHSSIRPNRAGRLDRQPGRWDPRTPNPVHTSP
jgi:hypothetical protein